MADELAKLIEAVSATQNDLCLRLRTSSSLKLGLYRFCSILNYGVKVIDDEKRNDIDIKLGLESWSVSQIHSVCSIATLIASASRSLSGISLFDIDMYYMNFYFSWKDDFLNILWIFFFE